MASIFAKKPLSVLLGEANSSGHGALKRTLGAGNLVALGVGAIIGAGLFVRTANAAAQASGPGVTLAFILEHIAFGSQHARPVCTFDHSDEQPIEGAN